MLENIYTTKMSASKKLLQNRFLKIRRKTGKAAKAMSFMMSLLVAITFVFATVVMAALTLDAEKEPITLYAKGEIISLENKPFIQENMTFFPLRETFEKLGVFEIPGNELLWDDGTIHITVRESAEKEIVSYTIKIGSDVIDVKNNRDTRVRVDLNAKPTTDLNAKPIADMKLVLPEETPILVGDKTYVPYTYIDYMLNRGLGLRNKSSVFDFMFMINGEPRTAFLSQGFVWPCDGDISNAFGERVHPITQEVKKHNGIDIKATEGTEVKSAIYGTVTETGYNAERGYFVIIERDNIQTVYACLTEDIQVKKGDEVVRGQIIGKVGNTGKSTGAHLHFEVLINGEYFDPERIG